MPDNEINIQELETMTNAEEGFGPSLEQPDSEAGQPLPDESQPAPEASEGTPAQSQPDISSELKKVLGETPYMSDDVVESVRKLNEGYKNIQSQYTKVNEKFKPWEQIVSLASSDPKFANALQQAMMFYQNPDLAKAYMGSPQPTDMRPDMYSPQYQVRGEDGQMYFDKQKYDAELEKWTERQLDNRLNQRLALVEQQTMDQRLRWEFKQKYPDIDPEQLERDATEKFKGMNKYEVFHKVLNWDTRESTLEAKLRKELTTQLEKATKGVTPTAPQGQSKPVDPAEIIAYIGKHGDKKAYEKFGRENVNKVLHEYAE